MALASMRHQCFNIRLVAAFDDGLAGCSATNAVLAGLTEGLEKCVFPIWAKRPDGEDCEITIADYETYP